MASETQDNWSITQRYNPPTTSWPESRLIRGTSWIPVLGSIIYTCAMSSLEKTFITESPKILASRPNFEAEDKYNAFASRIRKIEREYAALTIVRSLLAIAGVVTLTVLGMIAPPIMGVILGGICALELIVGIRAREIKNAELSELEPPSNYSVIEDVEWRVASLKKEIVNEVSSRMQGENPAIEHLKQQVEELSRRLETLSKTVQDKSGIVNEVSGRVQEEDTEVHRLKKQVEELSLRHATLSKTIQDKSGIVNKASGRVEEEDEIQRLKEQIAQLSLRLETLGKVSGRVEGEDTEIQCLKKQIAELSSRHDQLGRTVQETRSKLPDIQQLKEEQQKTSSALKVVKTDVASKVDKVDLLEKQVKVLSNTQKKIADVVEETRKEVATTAADAIEETAKQAAQAALQAQRFEEVAAIADWTNSAVIEVIAKQEQSKLPTS